MNHLHPILTTNSLLTFDWEEQVAAGHHSDVLNQTNCKETNEL